MPAGKDHRSPALQTFFAQVPDPSRPAIDASRIAIVTAHPDDETVGCGALLSRLHGVALIVVTDGAPRNLTDAHSHGFADAADYGEARRHELFAALSLAGVAPDAVTQLEIPDQEAAEHMDEIAMG